MNWANFKEAQAKTKSPPANEKKNKQPERREENNKIGFNAANIVLHIYPYLPLKYGLNDYLTDLHSQRNLVK